MLEEISKELKQLGINAAVDSTMPRSKITITFNSKEDMNLYKVSGSFKESNFLRFEIKP